MKNNRKLILGIIIGIIMMSGVGVVAAIFNAEDISFTPNDSSWEVTNVKEAMDSLYNLNSNNDIKMEEVHYSSVYTNTPESYTVQETGKYYVISSESFFRYGGGNITISASAAIAKNGTTVIEKSSNRTVNASYTQGLNIVVSEVVDCVEGDIISAPNTATASGGYIGSAATLRILKLS